MDCMLRGLRADLDDLSHVNLTRWQIAHEAERILLRAVQESGLTSLEPAITVLTQWWDARPKRNSLASIADHHALLGLIASVRFYAGGGS